MGSGNASLSKMKGELPIFRSANGITIPNIMEARKACTRAKTTITGASHFFWVWMMAMPIKACQKIHNRKLPSCPSQKQETI